MMLLNLFSLDKHTNKRKGFVLQYLKNTQPISLTIDGGNRMVACLKVDGTLEVGHSSGRDKNMCMGLIFYKLDQSGSINGGIFQ